MKGSRSSSKTSHLPQGIVINLVAAVARKLMHVATEIYTSYKSEWWFWLVRKQPRNIYAVISIWSLRQYGQEWLEVPSASGAPHAA